MSERGIPYSRNRKFGEDIRLLCSMNNLGITVIDKAQTLDEIARRVEMDSTTVKNFLDKLINEGYVSEFHIGEEVRYYVTPNGILKVSAAYT